MTTKRDTERVVNRNAWYDRTTDKPVDDATTIHITPKARGQLADGYTKLEMPAAAPTAKLSDGAKEHTGSKWPGPKGRVGTTLHGKASPSSAESFLRTAKNREFQAK